MSQTQGRASIEMMPGRKQMFINYEVLYVGIFLNPTGKALCYKPSKIDN